MFDLKKISELFTIAAPLLILCSCIRLITYYHYWHIPIIDYLSTSEILFSFIQPALVILGLASIYFGGTMLLAGLGILFVNLNIIKPKKGTKESTSNTNNKKFNRWEKIVFTLYILFLILIVAYFFIKGIWYDFNIVPVVLFHVLLWAMAIIMISKISNQKEKTATMSSFFWGTLITVISASFFYGRYQMNSTSLHSIPYILSLEDSSRIETNNRLIYLGKTNNYYFLYDSSASQSIIIPSDKVKEVRIKK